MLKRLIQTNTVSMENIPCQTSRPCETFMKPRHNKDRSGLPETTGDFLDGGNCFFRAICPEITNQGPVAESKCKFTPGVGRSKHYYFENTTVVFWTYFQNTIIVYSTYFQITTLTFKRLVCKHPTRNNFENTIALLVITHSSSPSHSQNPSLSSVSDKYQYG